MRSFLPLCNFAFSRCKKRANRGGAIDRFFSASANAKTRDSAWRRVSTAFAGLVTLALVEFGRAAVVGQGGNTPEKHIEAKDAAGTRDVAASQRATATGMAVLTSNRLESLVIKAN